MRVLPYWTVKPKRKEEGGLEVAGGGGGVGVLQKKKHNYVIFEFCVSSVPREIGKKWKKLKWNTWIRKFGVKNKKKKKKKRTITCGSCEDCPGCFSKSNRLKNEREGEICVR